MTTTFCTRCGDTATMKCSRCGDDPIPAYYCGRNCQRAHWSVHKLRCNTPGPTPEFTKNYLEIICSKIAGNIAQMRARGARCGPGHICVSVPAAVADFIRVHEHSMAYMVNIRYQPNDATTDDVVFEFTNHITLCTTLATDDLPSENGELEVYVLLEI